MTMLGWGMSDLQRILLGRFPPPVKRTQAVPIMVILTSADTSPWDVPSTWDDTNNTIEVVGGGAGGGGGGTGGGQSPAGGGGGGAYATISNLDLTPGGTVTFDVGAAGGGGSGAADGSVGGDTSFNGSTGNCSAQSICGEGGDGGKSGPNGGGSGAGGTTTNSIGTTKRVGGAGAATPGSVGGGGGGAAGDAAVGGAGSSSAGGAGGGSGSASGGAENTVGTNGTEWTTAGSGGGGGGGNKADGAAGGTDGAGGGGADNGKTAGTGTEGVIIITYEPLMAHSFTQYEYKWWTDTAAVVPSGPWGTPDLAKNTPIPFNNEALIDADIIRLRISMSNADATCGIDCDTWKLRFDALAPGGTCSSGTYADVATDGSCSGAWCVDDNASYADGAAVTDCTTGSNNCISTANIEQEVEESDNQFNNPIAITSTQDGEWDINLNAQILADATQYCFKIVKQSDGSDLPGGYTNYPQLISVPGNSNLMRHGNFFDSTGNERGFYWVL